MSGERHRWTRDDDLVAFYLARHGAHRLPFGEAAIVKLLGLKESSLAMRRANFASLDAEGRLGLSHVAKQSREIFGQYKGKTEGELRPLILGVLGRPPTK